MMISTQTIGMSSCRITQLGICINSPVSLPPLRRRAGHIKGSSDFGKGRGYNTLAIKKASSFSSSAEDASDCELPAKENGVRNLTGAKNVGLMDPVSPAKLGSIVDDQLPPLLSVVIDGLPPLQLSKYAHEAETRLHQYAERYQDVNSWDSYWRMGLFAASYLYPGEISVDRLVAMAINYALMFLVDDFFFDTPDEFHHDEYGINCEAPQKFKNISTTLDGSRWFCSMVYGLYFLLRMAVGFGLFVSEEALNVWMRLCCWPVYSSNSS